MKAWIPGYQTVDGRLRLLVTGKLLYEAMRSGTFQTTSHGRRRGGGETCRGLRGFPETGLEANERSGSISRGGSTEVPSATRDRIESSIHPAGTSILQSQ